MSSDVMPFLVGATIYAAVVATGYAAVVIYEKRSGKKLGRNGAVSSSDSFNDITNSMD